MVEINKQDLEAIKQALEGCDDFLLELTAALPFPNGVLTVVESSAPEDLQTEVDATLTILKKLLEG